MSVLHIFGLAAFVFTLVFTVRSYYGGPDPRAAIVEAWLNIVAGFTLNFFANLVLIPLMSPGGHMTALDNFAGGWCYTALSIFRQYAIRRWCQRSWHQLAARLAHLFN